MQLFRKLVDNVHSQSTLCRPHDISKKPSVCRIADGYRTIDMDLTTSV